MEKNRLSFCIVCIANYCRSPVFEHLLNEKYQGKYEFYSAGLNPMPHANMDKRSINYLNSIGIKTTMHNPKRVTKKMLDYFDYFIAVDTFVLMQLNSKFRNFSKKFLLSTYHLSSVDIIDPYKFNKIEDYNEVMESIKYTVNSINLNEFEKALWWLDGRVVMQRPAKPFTPVRFRLQPPVKYMKIAIIGFGFVGKALYSGLIDNSDTCLIDPKLNTSIIDLKDANPEIIFICVPTPVSDDGLSQDTSILEKVLIEIDNLKLSTSIVIKSTVLPDKLEELNALHEIIYNPEFLREKTANYDFINSDLIIIGGKKESSKN